MKSEEVSTLYIDITCFLISIQGVVMNYLDGFSEATGMTKEEAADQLSSMHYEYDEYSYEDGFADGMEFNEIWENEK